MFATVCIYHTVPSGSDRMFIRRSSTIFLSFVNIKPLGVNKAAAVWDIVASSASVKPLDILNTSFQHFFPAVCLTKMCSLKYFYMRLQDLFLVVVVATAPRSVTYNLKKTEPDEMWCFDTSVVWGKRTLPTFILASGWKNNSTRKTPA